jgi:uncharacterized protein (DUF697 family)
MFDAVRRWFSRGKQKDELIQKELDKLKEKLPTPLFWMFGKTQSGKTSIIKYLTGADEAEIGRGFQPCTRFSRQYQFPTAETPLVRFLDTRGLDEPDYDPAEDLERFNDEAHVVLIVAKAMDHAQDNVITHLRRIRKAQPRRPVVLVLTTLHEAYPQQQHPQPYPFDDDAKVADAEPPVPEGLLRSLDEQRRHFDGLFDRWVAVDLTPADEGFKEPHYGGAKLRQTLLDVLPAALGQTLISLHEATRGLQDLYARNALPYIVAYSTAAATAGAVPVPLVDLLLISAIQSRMVYHLGELYGQPLSRQRFKEIASALGLGVIARQVGREMIKFIPGIGTVVGSIASGALAGASTFALGKAFCYYYQAVHQGHVPQPADLRRYYKEQLSLAEKAWTGFGGKKADPAKTDVPAAAAQGEAAQGE